MEDWKRTEGAIWDALSSLEEEGEGGTYRGQTYEYHEIPKAKLSELTGLDFRQWWNRRVLEQLVEIGIVVRRVTGDRRTAFYSLPEGITHTEFFSRKGAARYAQKTAKLQTDEPEQPEPRPESHTQPLTTPAPVSISGETYVPVRDALVSNEKIFELLAALPTRDERERTCLKLANYAGPSTHRIADAMNSDNRQFREEGERADTILSVYLAVRAAQDARESHEIAQLLGQAVSHAHN